MMDYEVSLLELLVSLIIVLGPPIIATIVLHLSLDFDKIKSHKFFTEDYNIGKAKPHRELPRTESERSEIELDRVREKIFVSGQSSKGVEK